MICYFLAHDILLEIGAFPFLRQESPSVGSKYIAPTWLLGLLILFSESQPNFCKPSSIENPFHQGIATVMLPHPLWPPYYSLHEATPLSISSYSSWNLISALCKGNHFPKSPVLGTLFLVLGSILLSRACIPYLLLGPRWMFEQKSTNRQCFLRHFTFKG